MKPIHHYISCIVAVPIVFAFTIQPATAEYSPWMKIRKIESYGKILKRKKLVPVKIECKRGPGRKYWRNTLFRLKLAKNPPYKITAWKVIFQRAYTDNGGRPRAVRNTFQSRVVLPAGSSGISADCGILYNTARKKRFSLKKGIRRR